MPSYVVTGASRGIGYGFIQFLSKDPDNVVVGLVRDKVATDRKIQQEGIKNVTILQADITDRQALLAARDVVKTLTGGSLDYLINNAAYVSHLTTGRFLDEFESEPTLLDDDINTAFNTNVVGVINTINVFLPLIKKGRVKKVATLTSGMGDLDFINELGIWESAPYSISKAAVNVVVAKYSARYKDEGILFLSISPGVVDTAAAAAPGIEGLVQKFLKAAPNFPGPMTPLESVEQVLSVVNSKSVENGDGGLLMSHHGDKNWF
ncbi:uncharacterized protein Z520_05707 [Fonsecaea multimorphosa CBS 102226]|uniref:NAD(P)-binding protein n=1 Tax=Fonsecaea multimorphosa CBS 102226 TaxID=1442371 RepID=A0A0D2IN37_9EURO|nr:uncharacterized protein Z520_05707 [Fonsecaea multimorphosa CBS 102226]KIX98406.1 hypothetical protein Z520_05707 [Fonsecaea multimorphosa CBS 102226]OAL24600.1 hypothetical protein AYO22_05389 [Fonsecaea multimorphosa]